ncbi:methylated-DNA--[protein]-cysteine S-methyltransferase [Endozoicomonas arenosclerae]|uniref:methylated-DNA--[protein]-cysteine S-methyltransferase n=1 Tax=Endozoicomonas arenosclerae TaxID=1633495 RepID=UPI000A93DA20|nr:MGMT family protein [Endozoicomonas arenosclerae]
MGDRNALRAVANANGANGLSILVPCHRVIASSGELQGYAGGKRAKEKLLELEGALPYQQGSLFD